MTNCFTQNNISIKVSSSYSIFRILIGAFLFLGVLPFNKGALTFFASDSVGTIISYLFCATALLLVIFKFCTQPKSFDIFKDNGLLAICLFVFLGIILSSIGNTFSFQRILSFFCFIIFYVFSFSFFKTENELLLSLGLSLTYLILLSLLLYYKNDVNVMYIASASEIDFKGVASNRNSFAEIALLNIVIFSYFLAKYRIKILCFIVIAVSIFSIYLTKGATSLICCILLLLFLILNKKIRFLINSKLFYFVIAAGFIIVFLKNVSLMRPFLNLFEKSDTLTGRTDIWDVSLKLFLDKPLFGYGYDMTVLLDRGFLENDPHNGILYILLTQGFFGFAIFVFSIIYLVGDIKKGRDNLLVRCLFFFMLVWIIRSFVESGYSYTHFAFWVSALMVFSQTRFRGRINEG